MKYQAVLLSSIVCLAASSGFAQVHEAWVARFINPNGGWASVAAVRTDNQGNVYVTGSADVPSNFKDFITIKYNPAGQQQWTAHYDGPAHGYDEPTALVVDGAGNSYVTGFSDGGATTGPDYATVKYDTSGNQVWAVRYNGPGSGLDSPKAIALDGAGDVYVTGYATDLTGKREFATVKYSPAGVQLWVGEYGAATSGDDEPTALAVDSTGNAFVTGSSDNGTNSMYATVKYNPAGQQQWATATGLANLSYVPAAIAIDGTGSAFVTGRAYEVASATSHWDVFTLKYNPDGSVAWTNVYNNADHQDYGRAIGLDNAGNVIVAGETLTSGRDSDYLIQKLDPSGLQLWVHTYNGTAGRDDELSGLRVDPLGSIYVTGRSRSAGTGWDYATLKYNSSGDVKWIERYDGGNGSSDEAMDLAFRTDGSLYVTGVSGRPTNIVTIKYMQGLPFPIAAVPVYHGLVRSGGGQVIDANHPLVVESGDGGSSAQAVVGGIASVSDPTDVWFQLHAISSLSGVTQTIEAYDWAAKTYVMADTRKSGKQGDFTDVGLPNPARFIHAGTGAIQVRLTWKTTVPTVDWKVKVDRAVGISD